jgi:hypothetical protein
MHFVSHFLWPDMILLQPVAHKDLVVKCLDRLPSVDTLHQEMVWVVEISIRFGIIHLNAW